MARSRLSGSKYLHVLVKQALLGRSRIGGRIVPPEKGTKVDPSGIVDRVGSTEDKVLEPDGFDTVVV